MNPELYERYLAKKAKKLGISVEELKAQGVSPVSGESNSTSSSSSTTASVINENSSEQTEYKKPEYVQQTIQQELYNQEQEKYQPLTPQPEKIESNSSYIFGPSQSAVNTSSQNKYSQPEPQQTYINNSQYTSNMVQNNQNLQGSSYSQNNYSNSCPQSSFSQQNSTQNSYEYLKHHDEKVVSSSSYIFGPSKMNEGTTPLYAQDANVQNIKPTINDNRENKFAIIGYPLGHSLSKVIHEAGFKSLGITGQYDILETPPDTLVDRIKWLKANGYKGFNVTIPLKLPISLFVDEVDNYADIARAVNTVYIDADKTMKAYNTDVIGFRRAIPSDVDLKGKKVAVLGTGGAAHAACVALTECGVEEIAFFTRNIPNSIELMNYVRRKFPQVNFNVYQIENIRSLNEYAMLVNTTPIGMLGKAGDMMPVEPKALESLNKDAIVYDIIYNPKKTVMIKAAEKLGLRVITGLDMLIYQAVAAQEIWFKQDQNTLCTPDFKDMKIAALEEL